MLPDTSQAATLGLSKPLAAIAKSFEPLGQAVPGLTYRLCVESETVPVSCSIRQPVGLPVAADVTGDGKPDLAADLVPTADPGGGSVGLRFAVRRLGEENLKAQVWAEYDGKVSVGFDGLRRGTSLSASDKGTFTVDSTGKRVKAVVERKEPGQSAAMVAGLTGRSAVSMRQTPATTRLTVNAALDTRALDVAASAPAKLEAVALRGGRLTHAVLDRMGTSAKVRLAHGEVRFASPTAIAHARVDDLDYRDGQLNRVTRAELERVPRTFTAKYVAGGGKQSLAVAAGAGRAGSRRGEHALLRPGRRQDRAQGGAERAARQGEPGQRPRAAPDHPVVQLAHRQVRRRAAAQRGRRRHPARRPRHHDQGRLRHRRVGAGVRAVRVRRHVRGRAARPSEDGLQRALVRRRGRHRPHPRGRPGDQQHARGRGRDARPVRQEGGLPGQRHDQAGAGHVHEPQVGPHHRRHPARRARRREGVVGAGGACDGQGQHVRKARRDGDLCQ